MHYEIIQNPHVEDPLYSKCWNRESYEWYWSIYNFRGIQHNECIRI